MLTFKQYLTETKENIPDYITVNGIKRPTRNSDNIVIHPTLKGIENFWAWFGDSKIVDSKGRPLVCYHSTSWDFDTFKDADGGNFEWFLDKIKDNKRIPLATLRKGSFFTPDKSEYDGYGNFKYIVYLALKNPITAEGFSYKNPSMPDMTKSTDGIIITFDGVIKEIISINPNAIKSAIGNNGNFSKASNKITESI